MSFHLYNAARALVRRRFERLTLEDSFVGWLDRRETWAYRSADAVVTISPEDAASIAARAPAVPVVPVPFQPFAAQEAHGAGVGRRKLTLA